MRYLGGKARIGNKLASYINTRLSPNQPYWEPMVGAGWIISKIDPNRKRMASDIHPELIHMWIELQNGWEPPKYVDETLYYKVKECKYNPHIRAFVGFGCSWGGKYWGGYARDNTDRNYAENAFNSLMSKKNFIKDVEFFCADYKKVEPLYNSFIFCDPPYDGTTEYRDKFNSIDFWQWVRETTLKGHIVLVSEYKAPPDFTCVWSQKTKTDIRVNNKKEIRTEKLFEYIKDNNQ